MKNSIQTALDRWYSAMHYLLEPHFKMPARRIDYLSCNGVWKSARDYPLLDDTPQFVGNYVQYSGGHSQYSVSYPLFMLSEAVLLRQYRQPFRRLLDEYGFMGAEGVMLLGRALEACFEQTLALIEAMLDDSSIENIEVVLLRDQLDEYLQYQPEKQSKLIDLCGRFGISEVEYKIFEPLRGVTTNAKGIKNTIEYLQTVDEIDQLVKGMLSIRGLLTAMPGDKITRLSKPLEPLMLFAGHDHPAVRDLALVCCNTVGKYLFEHSLTKKPELCLSYLNLLLDNNIDPDINMAQKSVTELVLGERSAAEASWNALLEMIPENAKLPEIRYHEGVYTASEWRQFTYIYMKEQGLNL